MVNVKRDSPSRSAHSAYLLATMPHCKKQGQQINVACSLKYFENLKMEKSYGYNIRVMLQIEDTVLYWNITPTAALCVRAEGSGE